MSSHYEPKTVAEWGRIIDNECSAKLGGWKIVQRCVFSSRAYRALTLPQREILFCYLNKVVFKKLEKRQRTNAKHRPEAINARNLIVTNGEIRARGGVRSETTMASARKRLVEIGFLDIVREGQFPQPGIYALSDRYLNFPDGDYRPEPKPEKIENVGYAREGVKGSRGFPQKPHVELVH